jgi:hypothetical protein
VPSAESRQLMNESHTLLQIAKTLLDRNKLNILNYFRKKSTANILGDHEMLPLFLFKSGRKNYRYLLSSLFLEM